MELLGSVTPNAKQSEAAFPELRLVTHTGCFVLDASKECVYPMSGFGLHKDGPDSEFNAANLCNTILLAATDL